MTKQIIKWLQIFASTIFYTALVFSGSCTKEPATPEPDNPAKDSSLIVYTDVIPDSIIFILQLWVDSFRLDLNNDGIYDFNFYKSKTLRCEDRFLGTYGSELGLSVIPVGENNAVMTDGSNLPLALDSSVAVTPDSLWAIAPRHLLYGPIDVVGRCISNIQPIRGHWINVSDKYLALKFNNGNNTYYGWVRVTCSYNTTNWRILNNGDFIVKDYAYNSIPNKPILAGQTK